MIQEFSSMSAAATYAARYFADCDDCNPIPILIAGQQWHVCGPTSGSWLAAYDDEENTIVRIGDLTFAN